MMNRLDERYTQRMQTTIETITEIIVQRTVERVTIEQIAQREPSHSLLGTVSDAPTGTVGTIESEREPLELSDGSDLEGRLLTAYKTLSTQGHVTVDALRLSARCRKVTASEWLKRQQETEVA